MLTKVNRQVHKTAFEAAGQGPKADRGGGGKVHILGPIFRYGGAVLAVAAATGLRWLLQDYFGTGVAFTTFFPTVAVVAMLAGGGPSLLATVLSAAVVRSWLEFGTGSAGEMLAMGFFLAAGLMVSATAEMLRRARNRDVAGLAEQVAERTSHLQQANARLRESEDRLRLFIEHAPAAIAMFDHDMRYLAVSRRWLSDYLSDRGNVLGRMAYEVYPECPERWRAAHRRGLAGEIVREDEESWTTADGQTLWARYEVRPWYAAGASIGGIVVFTEDITERKRAEHALRESEQRFRVMADAAPVLIWISGTDKLCTWFNKPWLDFVGRPIEQELGNGWTENIHLDDHARCLKTYVTAFDAHEPFSSEYRLRRCDGRYRWLLDNGIPLRNASGEFAGYIGSCIDITERRGAEEALRESEERFRRLAEGIRLIPWEADPSTWEFTYVGPQAADILGFPPDQWYTHPRFWVEHIHADDRNWAVNFCKQRCERHEPHFNFEYRMIAADGRVVWFHDIVNFAQDGSRAGKLRGFLVDITDRKKAEEGLRESEERLRAILNTAADAIVSINEQGIIQSVNPATERMFGYTAAELQGQNVNMLMPSPYHEDHDGYIRRYLETGQARAIGIDREIVGRRKDGSTFPADLAVSEVNQPHLFTGIIRDISRRKELEREVVEIASLEQRRIGQDLHDSVGQELTALTLLTRDLADSLGSDPATAAKLLDRTKDGLQRCQQELRSVLRGLLPVSVDSQGLMAALADLADRVQSESKGACTFECAEPVTLIDNLIATHLYLIAQEAVLNAVKHARAKDIRITLTSDRVLTLRVQDDGVGMSSRPAEIQGLGLRIMRNRAAIVGATLTIAPARPTGTIVTCVLPRKDHG